MENQVTVFCDLTCSQINWYKMSLFGQVSSTSLTVYIFSCCSCFKIILQERENRRQKFLQDMMAGRIESRVLRYMPAMTTDAVQSDPSTAECSMQQPAAGVTGMNLSSATKRAVLLSRIHSRRFREWACVLFAARYRKSNVTPVWAGVSLWASGQIAPKWLQCSRKKGLFNVGHIQFEIIFIRCFGGTSIGDLV